MNTPFPNLDQELQMPFSKENIIKIAKHNDQIVFRELFDVYHAQLFVLAKYYTKSNELAEEVVSDVFYKVWKNRQKLPKVSNLEGYLYTMAKHQSVDHIRSLSNVQFMSIDKAELNIHLKSDDPEKQLLSDELFSLFEKSISSLPDKCGLVFRLVKQDGLKYREVAEMLDISVKTVEKHVGVALKIIRKDLEGYSGYSRIKIKNIIYMALLLGSLSIFL